MHSARFCNYVLFDHQATHVVGSVQQRQLADFEPLCNPTALDVGDVVEVQSRDGLRVQVFERATRRDVRQVCVIGLKGPTNERSKAMRFILQLP